MIGYSIKARIQAEKIFPEPGCSGSLELENGDMDWYLMIWRMKWTCAY